MAESDFPKFKRALERGPRSSNAVASAPKKVVLTDEQKTRLAADIKDSLCAELVLLGYPKSKSLRSVDKLIEGFNVTINTAPEKRFAGDIPSAIQLEIDTGGLSFEPTWDKVGDRLTSVCFGTYNHSLGSVAQDGGATVKVRANTLEDMLKGVNEALSPENKIDTERYLGRGK